MQIGGDAGLQMRVPVEAGPHVVGVSFVRELWEPEGLPQPLQRGRVITNDQVYMDYANVGSVQIGGPYTEFRAGEGHAQPPRDFRLSAEPCVGRESLRHEDPFENGPSRLSPARDDRTTWRRWSEFFDAGRSDGGSFDAGIQFALERMLVDPGLPAARAQRAPGAVDSRRSTRLLLIG